MFIRTLKTVCLLTSVLLVGTAQAQTELLTNPDFAMDLSDWDNLNQRPARWDARDAANSPSSGSALITNVGVSNGGIPLTLSQCIRVNAGIEYGFGATVLVPTGQPEQTVAHLFVQGYAGTDCMGETIQRENIASGAVESWLPIGGTLFTANTVSSVRLSLGAGKPNGVSADAQAHFDDVYLRRTASGGIIDERYSGSWFNPATAGQGFFLDISPNLNLFFGGWFTWTDTPGQIDWMTVQGNYSGNTAMVPIFRSSGGKFNDPSPVTTVAAGVAAFRFTSCTQGEVTIEFIGTGTTTVIPLERITPALPGC